MSSNDTEDDARRRAYWAEQMELGYQFVEKLIEFPVEECGEGFASIADEAESAGVEMLFSDTKIVDDLYRTLGDDLAGVDQRLCLLAHQH